MILTVAVAAFVVAPRKSFLSSPLTAALAWAEEKGLDAQIVRESETLFQLRKSAQVEQEMENSAIFEDVKKWCANVDDPSNIAR